MDKKTAQELQLLGAVGIVREVINIPLRSSRSKLLWALALTLLLPLSSATLGQNFFFGPPILQIKDKLIRLPGKTTWPELDWEWRELFVVFVAYLAFVSALSLLSTAAVVYTVASIYAADTKNLKLSYMRVLSADVPRVWKRLTLTFLWFSMISFSFMMASVLAIIFLLIVFYTTILLYSAGEEGDHKLKLGTFAFDEILVTVVIFCSQMYITMLWHLAIVVSVLEDKYYGLAAMLKSSNLIKGKKKTALVLFIVIFIFEEIITWLYQYEVVEGRRHGVGIATRAVNGTLLIGLHCFVNLMWLLTQSVLYFVCKWYHHESIDDHSSFEVYTVGDYEPLKTSSIQLEHLHAMV